MDPFFRCLESMYVFPFEHEDIPAFAMLAFGPTVFKKCTTLDPVPQTPMILSQVFLFLVVFEGSQEIGKKRLPKR